MANKKEKKINTKPLSTYEEDAMWMSYRYAIGRHTIAAFMHAGHLIQANYYRLTDEQKTKTVYDMRREINFSLENEFNFGLVLYVPMDKYDPFKALLEFAQRPQVKDIGLMKYLKENRVSVRVDNDGKFEWALSNPIYNIEKYMSNFSDLLEWAKVSNALDVNKHHIVVTEYNGKVEEHYCFEFVKLGENDSLELAYADIDEYLNNPFVNMYLTPEYIKEINPVK